MGKAAKEWHPSPRTHRLYTRGGCPWLALAIHAETGWPLAMLVDDASIDRWGDVELPYIAHVFVWTPDFRALDIEGVRTIEDMKKYWHDVREPRVVDISEEELLNLMTDEMPLEGCDVKDLERARTVARKLLARELT